MPIQEILKPVVEARRFVARPAGRLLLASAGASLVLACSFGSIRNPRSESQTQREVPLVIAPNSKPMDPATQEYIDEIEHMLEVDKSLRHDCPVENINSELVNLERGRDTYIPREIKAVDETKGVILRLRAGMKSFLSEEAAYILNAHPNDDIRKMLVLGSAYDAIRAANSEAAQYYQDQGEVLEELGYLDQCHTVKINSLIGKVYIVYLRAGIVNPPVRKERLPFGTV